jgi:hypothetical protein
METMSEYQDNFLNPYVYVVMEHSDEGMQVWLFDDSLVAFKFAKQEFGKWREAFHLEKDDESVEKGAGWDQGDIPSSASIDIEPYPWIKVVKQKVMSHIRPTKMDQP